MTKEQISKIARCIVDIHVFEDARREVLTIVRVAPILERLRLVDSKNGFIRDIIENIPFTKEDYESSYSNWCKAKNCDPDDSYSKEYYNNQQDDEEALWIYAVSPWLSDELFRQGEKVISPSSTGSKMGYWFVTHGNPLVENSAILAIAERCGKRGLESFKRNLDEAFEE